MEEVQAAVAGWVEKAAVEKAAVAAQVQVVHQRTAPMEER
jgi:hypothetical protein